MAEKNSQVSATIVATIMMVEHSFDRRGIVRAALRVRFMQVDRQLFGAGNRSIGRTGARRGRPAFVTSLPATFTLR